MSMKSYRTSVVLLLLMTISNSGLALAAARAAQEKPLVFKNVASQTMEFIAYYHSISLTPEQKKIKEQALGSIPAPCCKDFSALTCCCPCNFAKSLWGLSNYLIAKRGYTVAQLHGAALEWINFTHANGFAGDGCNKDRCGLATSADGCGGMQEQQLVF